MSANRDLYDRKVNRSAMLRLHENKITGDMTAELDNHSMRLDDLIKSGVLRDSPRLHEALDKELVRTYGTIKSKHTQSLLSLFADQIGYTLNSLGLTVGKLFHVQQPTQRVGENVVLKRPLIGDKTLDAGWADQTAASKKRIVSTIRRGVAEGKSEADIARMIRGESKTSVTSAIGLARTSITSVTSQADYSVYKSNAALIKGWQYVAVLDSRTTPLCAHRNGHVYPTSDTAHLPPAHWLCRSTTVPVVHDLDTLAKSEQLVHLRRKNFGELSRKEQSYFDGIAYQDESYGSWLYRQPHAIQRQHLGSELAVQEFNSGQLTLDRFMDGGRQISLRKLRAITDPDPALDGHTVRFASAKEKLDSLNLGATSPDDFHSDKGLTKNLREYYILQSRELDGTLSLTNYRGVNIGVKKAAKNRVLNTPPSEDHLKYNPLTGRYDDARMYTPNPYVYENSKKLVNESKELTDADKAYILKMTDGLDGEMSSNERAVVMENLRISFTRYRKNGERWNNFKAVSQGQIKYDIMNVSDMLETQAREDTHLLRRLADDQFIDPVLGPQQISNLHDELIPNIRYINRWDDVEAPRMGRKLQGIIDTKLPIKIRMRLSGQQRELFYARLAKRLAACDSPDRDQLAVSIGRDLYNSANYRGTRREWYELGLRILDDAQDKGIYKLESFGVQKRRMKSMKGNHYFGPYYDTQMTYLRITDPKMLEYSRRQRAVDVGMRVGSIDGDRNRFVIRKGYKTYFVDEGVLGYYDTRIPVTSTSSYTDFPEDLIDDNMVEALNWTGSAEYRIDKDYHSFMTRLLHFQDDHGQAKRYNDLNGYRHYMVERGDAYERLKMMDYLVQKDSKFSHVAFLDHRGRIYERAFIGPQSGESFRPYLSTAVSKKWEPEDYHNLQDQIGAFLGGASDKLEGRHNSLTVLGRQKVAEKHKKELIEIGRRMLSNKPDDVRYVLRSELVQSVDGEEQAKLLRFAMESAKIDAHLQGKYRRGDLVKLKDYSSAFALEQDASSSGAQIIALTTRNKQLAELSNVVPTNQKRRLYDEIAYDTYHDPRFKKLNKKLGLTEKDLRKAAKAQNMVESLPCINTVNSGKPYRGNPEPSLDSNVFEGATTRTNDPYWIMKSVEIMPISKRGDVLFQRWMTT